jgi:hypothetical protein
MSNSFPVENDLNEGDALSPSLLKLTLGYTIRKVQESRGSGVGTNMSVHCLCQ